MTNHIQDVDLPSCLGGSVLSVRFSPDDSLLAASGSTGAIKVFVLGENCKAMTLYPSTEKDPATQIRWRPSISGSDSKNVLVSLTGVVKHWQVMTGKGSKIEQTFASDQDSSKGIAGKTLSNIGNPSSEFQRIGTPLGDTDNPLHCLDYYHDGTAFATAGKNRQVHVYDEHTKQKSALLSGGEGGHTNRIFGLRYHPYDKNTLFTGGWDNTVQVWDIRQRHPARSIPGPFISGDAIDVSEDGSQVLTGSHRASNQLQLWNVSSGSHAGDIPWGPDREVVACGEEGEDMRGDIGEECMNGPLYSEKSEEKKEEKNKENSEKNSEQNNEKNGEKDSEKNCEKSENKTRNNPLNNLVNTNPLNPLKNKLNNTLKNVTSTNLPHFPFSKSSPFAIASQTAPSSSKCLLYTCQFNKGSQMLVAGGTGCNDSAKIFTFANSSEKTPHVSRAFSLGSKACFTADFSHDGKLVALGGEDGIIRVRRV